MLIRRNNRNTFIATIWGAVVLFGTILPGATVMGRQQPEPVTLYRASIVPAYSLDPQVTSLDVDVTIIENLFLGLTNKHPITGEIVPELASRWTVSDDGRIWTFYLRDDVPWVRWDPATQTSEVLRTVTAYDAAYAIKRVCDPRLEAAYAGMAGRVIQGCNALAAKPMNQVTEADYDLVQVHALDDTTLEIHLQFAAGYFLSMTPMWVFHPVPCETIEENGANWTEPGTIVTNGPYVLDSWTPGDELVLLSNPLFPTELRGPGNIERVVWKWLDTWIDIFALYQDHLVDWTLVPPPEKQAVLTDDQYADQRLISYDYLVYYFAFAHDKSPFNDVHVRRAFAAAFDRQRFVDTIIARGVLSPAMPMIHFTAPGVFGAPPIDEVGMGYDPDYARAQLALAGYPDCEGLPAIEILVWEKAGVWSEFLVDNLADTLGCDPARMKYQEVPSPILMAAIDSGLPAEDRPHMWTLVWGADYPDANSYVGDLLGCESGHSFLNRPCTEIDDVIGQAAAESDVVTRADLYHEIEERFFGPEGEHPIIPLFMSGSLALHKPWYTGPFLTDWFAHYDWYTIDQAAQLAARSE